MDYQEFTAISLGKPTVIEGETMRTFVFRPASPSPITTFTKSLEQAFIDHVVDALVRGGCRDVGLEAAVMKR